MEVIERRAPALNRVFGQRYSSQHRPRPPIARVHREGNNGKGLQLLAQAQTMQHLHSVRAGSDSRANLAENRGLLVNMGVDARFPQGYGSR